ncbi:MAG: hypothetical protein QOH89_3238 [Pseudonocardiales bacterium]|nr:hypothetical protein [Pseudonocardiales bacterium]
MSRTLGVTVRVAVGAAILGCLVWRLGTGPFLDGLHAVSGWSLAAAVLLCAVTTVCAAWRWTVVARGLGVPLSVRSAIGASYRAQFLNTVLPGGVLGDVHRGVRHGRDARDLSKGLRAVAWERIAGQLVQTLLALTVLCVLPSPLRAAMPVILAVLAVIAVLFVIVLRATRHSGAGRIGRWLGIAGSDVRRGLLARATWPRVVAASVVVVAGHVATFFVAARAAGVNVPAERLLPIALVVLLAMAVPASIGGWGPREGAAAWAFAAAGLGAAQGLAVAIAYGVLVMVSTLPGALLLLASRRSRRPAPRTAQPSGGAPRVLADAGRPVHG